jgi:hypothetical protein
MPRLEVTVQSWDTFAVIAGGAAAALLGLLFVAISIRLNVVAGSQELRNRSAQTLVLFGIVLLLAVLLAIPGQSRILLGAEVVVLAVLGGVGLDVLDRRAGRSRNRQGISRVLDLIAPNAVTTVLLLASGVLLLCNLEAGLYFLVPPVIAAFVGGLTSAWLYMIRLGE